MGLDVSKGDLEQSCTRLALVFSHGTFKIPGMRKRLTNESDVSALKSVLWKFGFHTEVYEDLEYLDILKTIHYHAVIKDHSDSDCLLVVTLTHGDNGGLLYAHDREYYTHEIWSPFIHCKTLIAKPKLFLFQASQGSREERRKRNRDRVKIFSAPPVEYLPILPHSPEFLIASSAIEALHASKGHVDTSGTYYIQALCKELNSITRPMDIHSFLTRVNCDVMNMTREGGRGQTPTFISFLQHPFLVPNILSGSSFGLSSIAVQESIENLASQKEESTKNSVSNSSDMCVLHGGYQIDGPKQTLILYTSEYKQEAEAISPILKSLGFQVEGKLIDDVSLPEVLHSIASKEEMRNSCCISVIVFAEIYHKLVFGLDFHEVLCVKTSSHIFAINHLWNLCTSNYLPHLVGKPKLLFFLDTKSRESVSYPENYIGKGLTENVSINEQPDILLVYGYGEKFFNRLKKELTNATDDLLQILTRAMHTSCSGRLPHIKSTLRYPLHLLEDADMKNVENTADSELNADCEYLSLQDSDEESTTTLSVSSVGQKLSPKHSEVHEVSTESMFCLSDAVRQGNTQLVKSMIESGLESLLQDARGDTPLHVAVTERNAKMTKILLKCKIDINIPNYRGFTALHIATQYGYADIIRILLENGANPNLSDNANITPLHLAAEKHPLFIAKILVENGACVNAYDLNGATPLHYAAAGGNLIVTWYLVTNGAKVQAVTNVGDTPLHFAVACKNIELVEMLIDLRADVLVRNNIGDTPLHKASAAGCVDSVMVLLNKGANVKSVNRDKDMPLHIASRNGHLELAKYLIKSGVDVGVVGKGGNTPLHMASFYGHTSVAKLLLKKGASVHSSNFTGNTPLHLAAFGGHLELSTLIVEKAGDVNCINNDGCTPLHEAANKGYENIVQYLLQNGANESFRNKHGYTPLHWAANKGFTEIVRLFLRRAANVHCKERYENTALHEAAWHGRVDIVKMLLKYGASANDSNRIRYTPLHCASIQGHDEVLSILLCNKAIVDFKDQNESTPLHHAARKGHYRIAKLLVDSGADVKIKNKISNTPLHETAISGSLDIAKLLISSGADMNIKNKKGLTPLHHVASYGHVELCRQFLQSSDTLDGVEIDCKDKKGNTPIHFASLNGFNELAGLLIGRHTDVHCKNNIGITPLHYAAIGGHLELATVLIENGAEIDTTDNLGYKPLHWAASRNHSTFVQFLLQKLAEKETGEIA